MLEVLGLDISDLVIFALCTAMGVPAVALKMRRLKTIVQGVSKVLDASDTDNGILRKQLIAEGVTEVVDALPFGVDEVQEVIKPK